MKIRKRVVCQGVVDIDDYIGDYVSEVLGGTLDNYTVNDKTKEIIVTYTDDDGKQHTNTLNAYDVADSYFNFEDFSDIDSELIVE